MLKALPKVLVHLNMKGLKILFLLENSNSHLGIKVGVATLMYMLKNGSV